MLETTDLQAGGQYELEAIMPEGQKVGADGGLPVLPASVLQGFILQAAERYGAQQSLGAAAKG